MKDAYESMIDFLLSWLTISMVFAIMLAVYALRDIERAIRELRVEVRTNADEAAERHRTVRATESDGKEMCSACGGTGAQTRR